MKNGYYIYRFKDENDVIIYVGKTINLENRFKNHENLTQDVKKIEYIECESEAEMAWKEIYYINLYYNELSKNIAMVYPGKMQGLFLDDQWIEYEYSVHSKNSRNDEDNIYVIKITMIDGYDGISTYYNGEDSEGIKCTDDPKAARRYGNATTIRKIVNKINRQLGDHGYCTVEIYLEDELSEQLFEYYNNNITRSKKLCLEYEELCIYIDSLKLRKKQTTSVVDKVALCKEIDIVRDKLKKIKGCPEWQDMITIEEIVLPYIHNEYNFEAAVAEVFKNRLTK